MNLLARPWFRIVLAVALAQTATNPPVAAADSTENAFQDAVHAGDPQQIPGAVFCAYYDSGGEGVAYHDSDAVNNGSGRLNPADGSYLNEFRKDDGVDISYTKQLNDLDSPCNRVTPPLGLLYVGWTEPGEWFKLTVQAAAPGTYVADVLYTAQRDGAVAIDIDGQSPGEPFPIPSTFDPAETIDWRQWHHWNVVRDAFSVKLPAGVSVLTVRIAAGGNMNLATFLFRPAGTPHTEAEITSVTTPDSPKPPPLR